MVRGFPIRFLLYIQRADHDKIATNPRDITLDPSVNLRPDGMSILCTESIGLYVP